MKRTFNDWMRALDRDSVVGEDATNLFGWNLEQEYERRFNEALEYFGDRPDLLRQECVSHLIELERLETRYIGVEEYEKCAAVRDIRTSLIREYRDWV